MGRSAPSVGVAPSYMEKINNIVNGDAGKRKRDDEDEEGRE